MKKIKYAFTIQDYMNGSTAETALDITPMVNDILMVDTVAYRVTARVLDQKERGLEICYILTTV